MVSEVVSRIADLIIPPTDTPESQVINAPGEVTVQLNDSLGAPVAVLGVPVTVQLGANPANGILSGTLTRLTDV